MATIKDVAQLAGVSTMTVSRAINSPNQVSPETQNQVQRAIENLGYRPNFLARSLARKLSKLVGVIYSNGYNEIYMKQITGIEKIAKQAGYEILLSNVSDYKSVVNGLNTLSSMQVDGFIILPLELDNINTFSKRQQSYNSLLKAYHFLDSRFGEINAKPCVFIGTELQAPHVRHVVMDYAQGSDLGLSILLNAGIKNITHLTSYWDKGIWKIRTDAYLKGMRRAGCDQYIRVERTENSVEGGYNRACELLKQENLPEAFLCGNDYMAIGTLQALVQANIKVPDRVKIVGQDGLELGRIIYPKLTSIDIQGEKSGKEAMKLLQKAIEAPDEAEHTVVIKQKAVLRDTTF